MHTRAAGRRPGSPASCTTPLRVCGRRRTTSAPPRPRSAHLPAARGRELAVPRGASGPSLPLPGARLAAEPRCGPGVRGGWGRRRAVRPYLAKSARAPPVAGRSAATLSHRADVTDGAPDCSLPYLVKQAAHWPAGQRAAEGKPGSGRAAPSPPDSAHAGDPRRSGSGSGRVCKLSARGPGRPSPEKPSRSQGGVLSVH